MSSNKDYIWDQLSIYQQLNLVGRRKTSKSKENSKNKLW